ncbi:MAG: dihydrolipoamide acetyltransferase family protein [Chloroflexota bacterium]
MADTVMMPKLGFDMAEGTLIRWVIAEGEPVAKGAVLAEIETDKATVEVESSFEGVVARHLVEQGSVVPVNTPIAIVAQPGEEVPADAGGAPTSEEPEKPAAKPEAKPAEEAAKPAQSAAAAPAATAATEGGRVKASPLARKIAQEKGLELAGIQGSGPGGRIVKKDVETYRPEATTAPGRPAGAAPGQSVPLTKLRTAIARRMAESKTSVPHFYITSEYDMAALMKLRKQVNGLLPEEAKISVNDFIIKAVALTLREFPNLNASFNGNTIVQHGAVNIGVAVAVSGGLLTIVCRDADQKPLKEIAAEIKSLVSRARDGKVRPDDIEGSTFSISNLGMFDVENFAAIINPPEAGILAVGAVKDVPVVKGGELAVGTRMKATISVDHRVSDGAEAAQFMQALAKYLQEPLRLLV